MKRQLAVILLVLSTVNIYSMGNRQSAPEPVQLYLNGNENAPFEAQANPGVDSQERAEQVMKALAAAYPNQIEKVEFRNGDWAALLRDIWFYYAQGRILPEELRANAANYSPLAFYRYQKELPPWRQPTPEETERFQNMASNRSSNPISRSPLFFDTLWRMHNRNESYDRVKSIRFLGRSVMVHYLILEVLSLVEEEILIAAKSNPQVQTWVNSISSMEGWMWRDIAETQSRSFHAYGIAVDILPRSLAGKETYWLWTTRSRNDWWNVSYNERYHPPAAVIEAFEKYGFVWGGKWLFYDTMHFEYRPEVFILNGMPPETRR
ncbi:MAG: M15 family metallopeptidase [Treponema sp.]|jgi:hypothetical protein|nr:M15 family metallopeptidase [Treponema sp.]